METTHTARRDGDAPDASVRNDDDCAPTWMTLKAASETAGCSVSALRKWYRAGLVRSQFATDGRRLVVYEDVHAHLTGQHLAPTGASSPAPEPVADGAVPVPLEDWQRVMAQIGHLHELAEQLADARERAARAEAEAVFLRERLRAASVTRVPALVREALTRARAALRRKQTPSWRTWT